MGWDILPAATSRNQAFGATNYPYEWRRPDVPGGFFHAGVDLGGPGIHGKPVYATRPGVIVPNLDPNHSIRQCAAIGGALVNEPYLGSFCVCLATDEGVTIEYGHLDSRAVSVGQRVSVGRVLGYVGTHGASCGDHAHIEVRRDGARQGPPWSVVLDPGPWLANGGADEVSKQDVLDGLNEYFKGGAAFGTSSTAETIRHTLEVARDVALLLQDTRSALGDTFNLGAYGQANDKPDAPRAYLAARVEPKLDQLITSLDQLGKTAVNGVDVDQLAAALAPHLGHLTPEEVQTVADKISSDLAGRLAQ